MRKIILELEIASIPAGSSAETVQTKVAEFVEYLNRAGIVTSKATFNYTLAGEITPS